jgi:site-specific DNA-methyltransferase (adenine-specific)
MNVITETHKIVEPKIELYNMDCMEYMATCKDNEFDLAIVDPPYGLNYESRVFKDGKKWDANIPPKEYFDELKRVSKNQIIWGGNFFLDYLGATKSIIVWDKKDTARNGLWKSELAWCSTDKGSYIYRHKQIGKRGFYVVECERIHPTQKPIALYEWLLKNYAETGNKILDTHLGSGSSAIASYNYKFDFVGLEIDKEYFDNAVKRFNNYKSQLTMF